MGCFAKFSVLVALVAIAVGSVTYWFQNTAGASGYGFRTDAAAVVADLDLSGQVIIVTGATGGIGYETAKVLAARGGKVFVVGRNQKKADAAAAELQKLVGTTGTLAGLAVDLASLASIHQGAQDFLKLDLPLNMLINNAGVMAIPERTETTDGFDMQMGTNHIGHHYFTNLLLDTLKKSSPSRVVDVSSLAHMGADLDFTSSPILETSPYDPWKAYGNSKMANILHARELTERLAGTGVTAYSLHPGGIMTGLQKYTDPLMVKVMGLLEPIAFKTIPQGASTTVFAATKATEPGAYYDDCNVAVFQKDKAAVDDAAVRKQFWETTENLISATVAKLNLK